MVDPPLLVQPLPPSSSDAEEAAEAESEVASLIVEMAANSPPLSGEPAEITLEPSLQSTSQVGNWDGQGEEEEGLGFLFGSLAAAGPAIAAAARSWSLWISSDIMQNPFKEEA